MASTPNYSWIMPDSTDLVKDLPADFATFGNAVDSTVYSNANAAIAKTLIDAKGDLIAGSAADTAARLAVGTDGQVLTADSTASTGVKWATASAGSMTLLSTTTLSGTSTTISSISQSYKDLYVLVYGATNSTSQERYSMAPNNDSSSAYYVCNYASAAGSSSTAYVAGQPILLTASYRNNLNVSTENAFVVYIKNYTAGSTIPKPIEIFAKYRDSGNTYEGAGQAAGGCIGIGAVTSLVFTAGGTTWNSGTVLLYGVN